MVLHTCMQRTECCGVVRSESRCWQCTVLLDEWQMLSPQIFEYGLSRMLLPRMRHRLRLPVSRGKVRCIVRYCCRLKARSGSVARREDWIIIPWNDSLYANRPTNERAEDGDLIRAQVNVRLSFQPFLRFTASLGSETDTLNYNWDCMYANECSLQFFSTWTN